MRHIITGAWAQRHTDAALLFLRVSVGLVFFMHGWQKWQGGIAQTSAFLETLQFPAPDLWAMLLIAVEVGGGIALIAGAYTRLAAKLTGIVAAVALLLVHASKGFFVAEGGLEFILLILAATVAILVFGPGRLSADKMFLKL